jgi:hypothetical protein
MNIDKTLNKVWFVMNGELVLNSEDSIDRLLSWASSVN